MHYDDCTIADDPAYCGPKLAMQVVGMAAALGWRPAVSPTSDGGAVQPDDGHRPGRGLGGTVGGLAFGSAGGVIGGALVGALAGNLVGRALDDQERAAACRGDATRVRRRDQRADRLHGRTDQAESRHDHRTAAPPATVVAAKPVGPKATRTDGSTCRPIELTATKNGQTTTETTTFCQAAGSSDSEASVRLIGQTSSLPIWAQGALMRLGLLLVALVAFASGAEAQQLDFKRISHSGDELLSYRWRDYLRQEHSVAFTLTRQAIREAEDLFAQYSLQDMWQVVEQRPARGGRALRQRRAHQHQAHLRRRALDGRVAQQDLDSLTRKVEARLRKSQHDYLARHLRRMVGERRIVVDFAAATSAQQGPLRAVAKALGDMPDVPSEDRGRVQLALSFFQAIPYATLDDKQRQGGDFLPASALLAENRGDCDSKAVALAAVLRNFTRFRKLAVVTMPGHAILGVEMPAEPGDATIRQGGRSTSRWRRRDRRSCRSAGSGRSPRGTSRAWRATSRSGRWSSRAAHS